MSQALTALLQLASPTLPVGAYSYSQGLESAIDGGLVRDEASALRWIADGLHLVLARYEAPVWLRLHRACRPPPAGAARAAMGRPENEAGHDQRAAIAACAAPTLGRRETLAFWNEDFLATRETAELRAETVQMGYSLMQLMRTLGQRPPFDAGEVAYPAAHAWACACWDIAEDEGLTAYLYGWTENQVMAALKTVPLGQSAGQRLLLGLRGAIDDAARIAGSLGDDELSTQTPMLALLSSQHETQYSRLFRS